MRPSAMLVSTTCRRCSKPLLTLSRSLMGADEVKQRLDRICEDCTTPAERAEMLSAQTEAAFKPARG